MKLQVCILKNPLLSAKFPKDPDSDITIHCNETQFRLQIAFLYLQSAFFEQTYQKGLSEVDLHQLDQDAVEQVLYALYGGQFTISSFQKLDKVYTAVNHLGVEACKQGLVQQLESQLHTLNPIQLLQFAYQHKVLTGQVSTLVLANDLEILRDPKYSMQFNKISAKVLNIVLLEYFSKANNSDNEITKANISGIMSDYFHINKIKPDEYFERHNLEILKEIWFQNHPAFYVPIYQQFPEDESYVSEVKQLRDRIKELEAYTAQQLNSINRLTQANSKLKERLSANSANHPNRSDLILFDSDEQHTVCHPVKSPAKSTFGSRYLEMPPRIPYYKYPDSQASQLQLRMNHTPPIKTMGGIKIMSRNNSRSRTPTLP